jgi:hypothetical protein
MKTFKQLLQNLPEDVANSMGGGGFGVGQAAQTSNPNLAGYDPVMGLGGRKKKKKKVQEKFAGCAVFNLTSEEYNKCMRGRMKYERWSKKMNMEDINNQDIRTYCHRNPGQPVVIKDSTTGIMAYLIPPSKR